MKIALFLKILVTTIVAGYFVTLVHAWDDGWAQLTSIEEEVLTKIIEVNRGYCACSEFTTLQQEGISSTVQEMVQSFDLGDERQRRKLAAALKADSRLAIDMTLAFIAKEGAVNGKTNRLFHQWKRTTNRLAKLVIDSQPNADEARVRAILEMRSGELYYYAKALAAYEAKPTEKNYAAVEFHANLAFEYAQELDQVMDVVSDDKEQGGEVDGIGYIESCGALQDEGTEIGAGEEIEMGAE